jgi:hypothetical protein
MKLEHTIVININEKRLANQIENEQAKQAKGTHCPQCEINKLKKECANAGENERAEQ